MNEDDCKSEMGAVNSRKCMIFLAGGFGNSMFQLALGEHLKNRGVDVVYHDGLVRNGVFARLLGWSVHDDKLRRAMLKNEDVTGDWTPRAVCYLLVRKLHKLLGLVDLHNFSNDMVDHARGNFFLFGYWQRGPHLNSLVYRKLRDRVRKLAPPNVTDLGLVAHSRRGDFRPAARLTDPFYLAALNQCREAEVCYLISDRDSDCGTWTERSGINVIRLAGGGVIEDFFSIHFASTVICSNSTFCYWAVALGDAKRIIIPSRLKVGRDWDLLFQSKDIVRMECKFAIESD